MAGWPGWINFKQRIDHNILQIPEVAAECWSRLSGAELYRLRGKPNIVLIIDNSEFPVVHEN